MKKGCIIAAVVVLVLGLIGIGGCVFFGAKFGMKFANAGVTFAVETAIAEYKRANPDAQVPTTNEAWAEILQGQTVNGTNLGDLIQDGKIVDTYQNPLKLEDGPDGKVKATSAGKDGEFGTADDIDSSMLDGLQQKIEEAAEKE